MARARLTSDDPYTVDDLCTLLGWSRPTVLAALKLGNLPGYQAVSGGKWTIPAAAYRSVADGTWQPQPRPITVTNPPTVLHTIPTKRKQAS